MNHLMNSENLSYMPVTHPYTHTHIYIYIYIYIIYIYIYMSHRGGYDNISVMFMLWALSINNKVGLVLFANIYLRHQSVVICRRWLYSLI